MINLFLIDLLFSAASSFNFHNDQVIDRMKHLSTFFMSKQIEFSGMTMVGDFNYTVYNDYFQYISGSENFFSRFSKTHSAGRALDHVR
jgi:hypothetical protein